METFLTRAITIVALICFLVVLLFSYVFYTAMTHAGQGEAR